MSDITAVNKEEKCKNSFLSSLAQLVKASETNNFNFVLDDNEFSGDEAEAVRLINLVIHNYKNAVEYDVMKFKLANDALGIALWDMDIVTADPVSPDNKVVWSQELRHMLGFSDENDFPNTIQALSDRFHPEDSAKTFAAFAAHFNDYTGKTPYDIEYRLMLTNGDYKWFHGLGTTLRDSAGIPLRVAGAVMDINEKRIKELEIQKSRERERQLEIQKESAQAANEAKTQFLANISHEIRTPMNAVLGMSELLLQEKINKRQFRYVKDINMAAMSLLEIINDILDASKIRAGKLNLAPVHYDFNAMIGNVLSIAQFLIEEKGIEFKQNIPEELPVCLYGDDIRLRQIILNLLSNAIKFTKDGYVYLGINVTDVSIRFTVSDTGIGIQSEDISRLFENFEQVNTHKTRTSSGTGLGLPISKALVEMMNGEITVESEYGVGSSFHVDIPLILGDEALIRHEDDTDIIISAPDAEVLVVDDNKMNLTVACGMLQLFQITADTASSGFEAIKMIQKKHYDIVFMDRMMPEMDGTETTRKIREMGIDVTIIALTASTAAGSEDRMLEAGMNDYLAKPIIKKDLILMLKNWIPGEKFQKASDNKNISKEPMNEDHRDFWKKVEQIKGLSLSTGLERVDGQWALYQKSLKLMIIEIDKCNINLQKFLSSDDIRNFCIDVHGIKGSLATIGTMELADMAYNLEMAANKSDIGYCTANTPLFLKKLNKLKSKLKEAFSEIKETQDLITAPPELLHIFANLAKAFNKTDLMAVNDEIESLKKLALKGSLKEEAEKIINAVMVMDYDGALKIMNALQEK